MLTLPGSLMPLSPKKIRLACSHLCVVFKQQADLTGQSDTKVMSALQQLTKLYGSSVTSVEAAAIDVSPLGRNS